MFNNKFRDHITSKRKPFTSWVNSFQPLTSAIKGSTPDASDACWSTSALPIFLYKQFLIHVNQFQHKTQKYIHSSWLILTKKRTNQTGNCNLKLISASGDMWGSWECSLWFNSKFNLIVAYPKSFDPLFSPQLFALTPKKLVVATKTFIYKDFVNINVYTSRVKFFIFIFVS